MQRKLKLIPKPKKEKVEKDARGAPLTGVAGVQRISILKRRGR